MTVPGWLKNWKESEPETVIGQKFNRLTIVKQLESRHGKRYFECLCDCGNTCFNSFSHLKRGTVKSCGCIVSEVSSARRRAMRFDLTGETKGFLTCIGDAPDTITPGNIPLWAIRCRCVCGTEVVKTAADFFKPNAGSSCGCMSRMHNVERAKLTRPKQFERYDVLKETIENNKAYAQIKCRVCGKVHDRKSFYLLKTEKLPACFCTPKLSKWSPK